MKNILSSILIVIAFNISNAQHSQRYLEIVKDLKEVSCEKDTTYYKNGKIWWISCWINYEYNSENYWLGTGKMIQYYKNGQIASEDSYDKYGNLISWNGYDRNGNKTIASVTTEIDTNAKSLDEFLESDKHFTSKRYIQLFRCSKNLGTCYVYKEGERVNGKKKGVWITYSDNGEIKKEKRY